MRFLLSLLSLILLISACSEHDPVDVGTELESVTSPIFERIPSTTSNITFNNHVEENFQNFFARFQYVYNGGGVAIGDVDGDGLQDIYFTANEQSNKLYRNMGDMTFEDITESAGVTGTRGWNNGVVVADVDGDGQL